MEEYKSVSEFAKIVGLSRQAIYKKLDNELTDFVKVDNGRKVIKMSAVDLFLPVETIEERKPVDRDSFTILQATLDTLTGQLDVKDRQLQEQAEQIKILHQLLDQQQRLQAAQQAIQEQSGKRETFGARLRYLITANRR